VSLRLSLSAALAKFDGEGFGGFVEDRARNGGASCEAGACASNYTGHAASEEFGLVGDKDCVGPIGFRNACGCFECVNNRGLCVDDDFGNDVVGARRQASIDGDGGVGAHE
jgi:hypothetical protein